MCGVAGSGKTTYAKLLETEGYVRLSIDEEVWARFGRYGLDYEPALYTGHATVAEAALRQQLLVLIEGARRRGGLQLLAAVLQRPLQVAH